MRMKMIMRSISHWEKPSMMTNLFTIISTTCLPDGGDDDDCTCLRSTQKHVGNQIDDVLGTLAAQVRALRTSVVAKRILCVEKSTFQSHDEDLHSGDTVRKFSIAKVTPLDRMDFLNSAIMGCPLGE